MAHMYACISQPLDTLVIYDPFPRPELAVQLRWNWESAVPCFLPSAARTTFLAFCTLSWLFTTLSAGQLVRGQLVHGQDINWGECGGMFYVLFRASSIRAVAQKRPRIVVL